MIANLIKKVFQKTALLSCKLAVSTGFLSTGIGHRFFMYAYYRYKAIYEPSLDHLSTLINPGDNILDIGANIGYFTVKFAKWVSSGGRVIAIEPEPANIKTLKMVLARNGLRNVDVIKAAAAEKDGSLFLSLNPLNPADHRLGESGIVIQAITIDSLLQETGWPVVSFIKIDVQGAELRVLAGAKETISRFKPTFLIEIDDKALRESGSSADDLVELLRLQGYQMFGTERTSIGMPVTDEDYKLRLQKMGYADFIFIHKKIRMAF